MAENLALVQQGFRILHPWLAGYIGQEMRREYGNDWWQEVMKTLSDQLRDLLLILQIVCGCLTESGMRFSGKNFLWTTVHGAKN